MLFAMCSNTFGNLLSRYILFIFSAINVSEYSNCFHRLRENRCQLLSMGAKKYILDEAGLKPDILQSRYENIIKILPNTCTEK